MAHAAAMVTAMDQWLLGASSRWLRRDSRAATAPLCYWGCHSPWPTLHDAVQTRSAEGVAAGEHTRSAIRLHSGGSSSGRLRLEWAVADGAALLRFDCRRCRCATAGWGACRGGHHRGGEAMGGGGWLVEGTMVLRWEWRRSRGSQKPRGNSGLALPVTAVSASQLCLAQNLLGTDNTHHELPRSSTCSERALPAFLVVGERRSFSARPLVFPCDPRSGSGPLALLPWQRCRCPDLRLQTIMVSEAASPSRHETARCVRRRHAPDSTVPLHGVRRAFVGTATAEALARCSRRVLITAPPLCTCGWLLPAG